jgi:hypothetical protein
MTTKARIKASTKDQRDIDEITSYAKEAEELAYDLYARRLDTRRNVASFIKVLQDSTC